MSASVTRLGDFWEFLALKNLTKVAQIFSDFWDILHHLVST